MNLKILVEALTKEERGELRSLLALQPQPPQGVTVQASVLVVGRWNRDGSLLIPSTALPELVVMPLSPVPDTMKMKKAWHPDKGGYFVFSRPSAREIGAMFTVDTWPNPADHWSLAVLMHTDRGLEFSLPE